MVHAEAGVALRGVAKHCRNSQMCVDAVVETFFKTIKSELVWRTVFYTRDQAAQAIARYIDGFYNPVRRHSALDYISPAQFERTASGRANASPLDRGKSRSMRRSLRSIGTAKYLEPSHRPLQRRHDD